MKKQRTKKIVSYHKHELPSDTKTDWKRVRAMTDKEIERNAYLDKDTILVDNKFWKSAKLVLPTATGKEKITVRVDTDILDWLRKQGKGYQSRINTILRTCMEALKQKSGHHLRHRN